MFCVRRAALRALSSSNASVAVVSRPRTFTSLSSVSAFRPHQQQWVSAVQRRFNSDDAEAARRAEEHSESEQTSALDSAADTASTMAENVASTVTGLTMGRRDPLTPIPPTTGRFEPQNSIKATIYVANLFFETTEEQIRSEFSPYGNIVQVHLARDPAGLSRGFAYVEMDSEDSAASAIQEMNQRVLDGRRLLVQFHRPKSIDDVRPNNRRSVSMINNPPGKTLFIGNMSYEMSDRDLNELFRDIKNVLDVRVAIDRRTGQPRGFAHADFMDETSATKAKEILTGRSLYGRQLRVDYSTDGTKR